MQQSEDLRKKTSPIWTAATSFVQPFVVQTYTCSACSDGWVWCAGQTAAAATVEAKSSACASTQCLLYQRASATIWTS